MLAIVKPEEAAQVVHLEENYRKRWHKTPENVDHRCMHCPFRMTFEQKKNVLDHLKKWPVLFPVSKFTYRQILTYLPPFLGMVLRHPKLLISSRFSMTVAWTINSFSCPRRRNLERWELHIARLSDNYLIRYAGL